MLEPFFQGHSSRNNYDVACPMNFRKYPYDTQICKVKYESCKLNTEWTSLIMREAEILIFKW